LPGIRTLNCRLARVLALAAVALGGVCTLPAQAFADGSTSIGGVISEDPSGVTSNASPKDPLVQTVQDELGGASGAVTYTSISITGQMQQEAAWCVPASVRASLTAFGVTQYQSSLAPKLGTTSSGTKMSAIAPVLNTYESRNSYVLNSNTSSSAQLLARVKVDTDDYKAPIIAGIQGGDLPLWVANGYTGYHAVALYGYASNNAWIQYDDPIDIDAMYGRQVTNKSFLFSGLQDEQNYIVW
jgi:hypothetical protein